MRSRSRFAQLLLLLSLTTFPARAEVREGPLYEKICESAADNNTVAVEKHGTLFLKSFPKSKHVPAVRKQVLPTLFVEGEYERCLRFGIPLLPKLPQPSLQHDTCVHVLGGSYYYLGQYANARPFLDFHRERYPKSPFRNAATYLHASNLFRLQHWKEAAKFLDQFLVNYPNPRDNIYFAFALYDRAHCHYALEEFPKALANLNRIEAEFPKCVLMDLAYNLKGEICEAQGKIDHAERYYLKGFKHSNELDNKDSAGESLFLLVRLLGQEQLNAKENHRLMDAVAHYDKLWTEYAEASFCKTHVAIAGIHALEKSGRGKEALNRLWKVIQELAEKPHPD